MTSNRIQKLLFSEYSDFEDIVLVEGPFAETDREGKGIRQVQLGLTPTKLILASYFVEPVAVEELGDQWRPRRGQDLDIESFELVSAYPVECVNLSVYRRRRRQTLKARFCNGNVVYFEIGGWQERKMLWSVWCERIKFLSPYESGVSASETSVGSSTSGSSLYIVRSSLSVNQTGKPTLWCYYACAEGSWPDPHVYLGPQFYDRGYNSLSILDVEASKSSVPKRKPHTSISKQRRRTEKEPLILSTEHEVTAAEAVELWEAGGSAKIRRRYALSPCPYLLGGFGPWRLSKPMAYSVQTKHNVSSVDLREAAEDVRLPLPKGRLLRTVSLESLAVLSARSGQQRQHEEVVFWTRYPEEELLQWGPVQYRAQLRHLRATRKHTDPHIFGIREKKKCSRKHSKTCLVTKTSRSKLTPENVDAHGGGGDTFPTRHIYSSLKHEGEEGWLLPLSKFTSSSLAHQLTMVHKQLFLQVTPLDLGRALSDMDSWRSPALRALVVFSHRISCVVVNHILLEHEVQKRARMIGKLMSVAYKCHRLNNMMSAEAVLRGLHSLPVYRLHRTWAFVRSHHATNYRRFEDLSRRYLDCRDPLFQKTYDDVVRVPPFLPTVALLTAVLQQSLPQPPAVPSSRFTTGRCLQGCFSADSIATPAGAIAAPGSVAAPDSNAAPGSVATSGSFSRLLSAFQLTSSPSQPQPSSCQSQTHLHSASRETLLEHLEMFFAPVSNTPSQRVLQDAQYFLESHQASASRYLIPINPRVRGFLLHSRHPDMRALYRQSLLIEA